MQDGDEDEELVPRQRVIMGMKFHDDEEGNTAWRVSRASLTLGVLVILHFLVHWIKSGHVGHAIPHLVLGMALPIIGFRAATLDDGSSRRARMLWVFHIGNAVFVILHAVILLVVCTAVMSITAASVESMCNWNHNDDPALRPANSHVPSAMPTMPPIQDDYRQCKRDVEREKAHAPGLMLLWLFMSFPYWVCAAYAAYHSHELYFQLCIRELTIHRDQRPQAVATGENLATVGWGDAAVE